LQTFFVDIARVGVRERSKNDANLVFGNLSNSKFKQRQGKVW